MRLPLTLLCIMVTLLFGMKMTIDFADANPHIHPGFFLAFAGMVVWIISEAINAGFACEHRKQLRAQRDELHKILAAGKMLNDEEREEIAQSFYKMVGAFKKAGMFNEDD